MVTELFRIGDEMSRCFTFYILKSTYGGDVWYRLNLRIKNKVWIYNL